MRLPCNTHLHHLSSAVMAVWMLWGRRTLQDFGSKETAKSLSKPLFLRHFCYWMILQRKVKGQMRREDDMKQSLLAWIKFSTRMRYLCGLPNICLLIDNSISNKCGKSSEVTLGKEWGNVQELLTPPRLGIQIKRTSSTVYTAPQGKKKKVLLFTHTHTT